MSMSRSPVGGSPALSHNGLGLQVFSTCPSSIISSDDYVNSVIRAARWSEHAGCTGMLIYTDNSHVDPWLIAQIIVQNTRSQCPLVAVQPAYMHPFSVAKMVSSLTFLHQRRIYLNMVAGGFKNDLVALNDTTPHDSRYERLVEYTHIIVRLLTGLPLTFTGKFYQVKGLMMQPSMDPELFPGILISGSSPAGQEAARVIGAIAVKYPEPRDLCMTKSDNPCGVRVGVISRADEDEAWRVARARFPEDRRGQLTHHFAMKVSDSVWHN